jgi:hypothetical protein
MMKNTNGMTPLCKFCQGAGESKEVYTSHWQFNKPKDGVLTCPKLLAYNCKKCNKAGHNEKHCTSTKQVKAIETVKTCAPVNTCAPVKTCAPIKENETKFCRFCYNANEQAYTGHYQFEKDGTITCPLLLDIECQLCGMKGHTKKYCTGQAKPKKHVSALHTQSLNDFPMLTPTLGTQSVATGNMDWATVTRKKKNEVVHVELVPVPAALVLVPVTAPAPAAPADTYVYTPMSESMSWADM